LLTIVKIHGNAEDVVRVFVKAFITPLEAYVLHDEKKCCHAQGQAGDVDDRENPVLEKIPVCYAEIVE
jgi:hypothetical protein